MLNKSVSLAMALACCSCSALTNTSQFAVRCSGNQAIKFSEETAPVQSNVDPRTYVFDSRRNAIYRADPFMVANLCSPGGQCDIEITSSRVSALMTRLFGTSKNGNIVETRFVFDRDKGELRTTDVTKSTINGDPGNPITTESTFTCVTVPVPDFKVPEA